MSASASLAGRFFLAFLLMIGFYLLALAIVAGLLYIPYAELTYAHRVHPKLVLFCLGGAGAILWSILPRLDRFTPPGPLLPRQAHPRLHQTIEAIAGKTQQAPPREVYLIPDVNAWVSQRGGIMGIGSRRVMGLGLPLMQALTVSEISAVLAHEFGHFYGGDTALGPWIYKTRVAIGRTLLGLSTHSSWLRKPFEWYAVAFLRVTHAISRRQEYIADRLAARVVGARALEDGLKKLHGAGLAFWSFWHSEMSPAIDQGYRPPLTQGFQQFLGSALIREHVQAAVELELREGKSDPYDTHPQLSERLAALAEMPRGESPAVDSSALTLLNSVQQLEDSLFKFMIPRRSSDLQSIEWDDLPEKVWLPVWVELARDSAGALRGLTPATLSQYAISKKALAVRLKLAAAEEVVPEESEQRAVRMVASALCALLHGRGWEISTRPGAPVVLQKGTVVICPFDQLEELSSGRLSPEEWKRQCDLAGIADLDLGELSDIKTSGCRTLLDENSNNARSRNRGDFMTQS